MRRQLLLYSHYDVQPTGDVARWRWEGVKCEPFVPAYFLDAGPVEPRALDDRALERVVVVARGGADNKGQHVSNILGAMDAVRAGTARWKVKIILDGEEEHGSPNLEAIARAHRARLAADVLIGSDGPKQRNAPTLVMGVRGLLTVDLVADNGRAASVHSGNYGNIVPNPVLPLARLVADIEERTRGWSGGDAFRREASEVFAKWEDKAVWTPFLRPTVNVNHFMTDGASPTLRRTIIPRSARAWLDIRLTPDTPLTAIRELVERAVADHQGRTPGITFTVQASGQPASYTSPARPGSGGCCVFWKSTATRRRWRCRSSAAPFPCTSSRTSSASPCLWIPAANSNNQQHDINVALRPHTSTARPPPSTPQSSPPARCRRAAGQPDGRADSWPKPFVNSTRVS